jgi:hypothetical protein
VSELVGGVFWGEGGGVLAIGRFLGSEHVMILEKCIDVRYHGSC